jgi:hypothetical protein
LQPRERPFHRHPQPQRKQPQRRSCTRYPSLF